MNFNIGSYQQEMNSDPVELIIVNTEDETDWHKQELFNAFISAPSNNYVGFARENPNTNVKLVQISKYTETPYYIPSGFVPWN